MAASKWSCSGGASAAGLTGFSVELGSMMVDLFWLILHDCDVLTNTKTLVLRHFVVYASQPGLITDRLDHMHTTLRRGFSNRRTAFSQQRPQFEDDREHLMVMISSLPVMRFLLALHNPSVFLE